MADHNTKDALLLPFFIHQRLLVIKLGIKKKKESIRNIGNVVRLITGIEDWKKKITQDRGKKFGG